MTLRAYSFPKYVQGDRTEWMVRIPDGWYEYRMDAMSTGWMVRVPDGCYEYRMDGGVPDVPVGEEEYLYTAVCSCMDNATVSNVSKSETANKIEQCFSSFTLTPKLVRILSGFAIGSFLGLGIRSALRHTRGAERAELGSVKLLSGVGLAFRALGLATVITCSSFGLLVVGISAAFDVNTPRQFGAKMRLLCGDRLRLNKKQSIATLREVFVIAEDTAVHPPDSIDGRSKQKAEKSRE